jgi:F-type H+-transporting ATPase subunit gamma
MSRSRDIERRIGLHRDLTDIVNAMRSFAFVELRRLAQRAVAQERALEALSLALADMAPAIATRRQPAADIWLLLGSVRGFCGSFNEDIVHCWREHGSPRPVVAVGERLWSLMPDDGQVTMVAGAGGALDALTVIEAVLAALEGLWTAAGDAGLMVVAAGEAGAAARRLLPLTPPATTLADLPILQEPEATVAGAVVQHYLFHRLMAELVRAIQVENHTRLSQMENALSHLGRQIEDLERRRNHLRQEEVIQEIELIAGGRKKAAHAGGAASAPARGISDIPGH